MGKKVSISQLSVAVMEELEEYADLAAEDMKSAVKKAAEIDSTHFRVEFNGELYNIAAVDHMNYRRKSIKLSCEKVRR